MRLTSDEIAGIRECTTAIFGGGATVRLFGSRTRDDLRGGDIDLHITAESDEDTTFERHDRFVAALETRIGARRVDVLVNGPGGPTRPIEKIAVATGIVLLDHRSPEPVALVSATRPLPDRTDVMVDSLQRELVAEAVARGEKTKERLTRILDELSAHLPLSAETLGKLDWEEQLRTDALLLQFTNLVGAVQDQLIRSILIAVEEPVERSSRIDQRHMAAKLGAFPDDIDFKAIVDARNAIAHHYPLDTEDQARVINTIVGVLPDLMRAFDMLANYARARVLSSE